MHNGMFVVVFDIEKDGFIATVTVFETQNSSEAARISYFRNGDTVFMGSRQWQSVDFHKLYKQTLKGR